MVQRGAGEAAHYHDREYADAGAQMVDTCEEVYTADIILKPTPVTQGDVEMMHDRQVILSPIELFELRKEAVVEMMQKKHQKGRIRQSSIIRSMMDMWRSILNIWRMQTEPVFRLPRMPKEIRGCWSMKMMIR